jgi:arylsulfatase A-like enzyme
MRPSVLRRLGSVRPALVLSALVLAGSASCERSGPVLGPYPGRNILLITVDTLRADHLGVYGYPRPTSPTIDRLASEGITFDYAFAPRGMTWPSLATMLTSLAPTTTNVRWNGQYLPVEVPTLAGILRDSGYRIGGFLGGSICHMARGTGKFRKLACGDDAYVTSRAIEFFRTPSDQPTFAWLHLLAPHAPYAPAAEHDRFTNKDYRGPVDRMRFALDAIVTKQMELSKADLEQLIGLYDGEVLSADAQVGLLLKALDELDERKDTIVVFSADHGEDLYEHNRYLYHACSIYDSALRIPMILALPDRAGAGTRYAPIVEMIDLAPTLLELVGIEPLPSFEGASMVAQVSGRERGDAAAAEAEKGPVATSEWYDPKLMKSLQTVRTSKWRYISNPEGLTPKCVPPGDYYRVAREELYDLEADPREQTNVAAGHPDVVEALSAFTQQGHAAATDDQPLPVDPKLSEELRSLGYLE